MRHEIETHPHKFDLSLDEFDIFFKEFPEGIAEDNFQDMIADYEVKLSKIAYSEEDKTTTEEDELVPNMNNETEESESTKSHDFIQDINKEEDDENDPEVTLDYILDGLIDSGKFDHLNLDEKTRLLERLQKLTKQVNTKIRILER